MASDFLMNCHGKLDVIPRNRNASFSETLPGRRVCPRGYDAMIMLPVVPYLGLASEHLTKTNVA